MRSITQSTEPLPNDLYNSIHGYNGYKTPETRNMSDKRLREFLSEKLQQIEKDLSTFEHRFYQRNKGAKLDIFHRISLSLKMLIQSFIEPSCNADQFFNRSSINQETLTQLYEYDVQLKNQIDILMDEVNELDFIDGEYEIEDMMNHLYDLIDGANQTLSERAFLMMGE